MYNCKGYVGWWRFVDIWEIGKVAALAKGEAQGRLGRSVWKLTLPTYGVTSFMFRCGQGFCLCVSVQCLKVVVGVCAVFDNIHAK